MFRKHADVTAYEKGARRTRRAALACALVLVCAPAAFARQESQKQPGVDIAKPVTINSLPFVEFARTGRTLVEAGKLGPDTTLDVTAAGEIDDSGMLKPDTVVFKWRAAGDENVRQFAQQFVSAVSQSRILDVIRGEVKTVRLSLRADRQNVSVGLEGEAASEDAATKLASSYGALLMFARVGMAGRPEVELYRATKIDSDGKLFRVSLELPKVAAAKAVADILDGRAAAQPSARPNQQ